MTHWFDEADSGRWCVMDWAGNHMCAGDFTDTYDTWEDAYAAVSIHIENMMAAGELSEDEAEEEYGEYYVYAVDRYLERERHEAAREYKMDRIRERGGSHTEWRAAWKARDPRGLTYSWCLDAPEYDLDGLRKMFKK